MASYHDYFKYNGANSASKGLIIVAFEPDDGFKDTFLSMDVVSDDYYDGSKRINYGSKYNATATIEIQLIKENGEDISLRDFRDYARWLTGARTDSWLEFYNENKFQYAFLGRVTDLQQYKMDGRTVGIKVVFSSVTPWAFSRQIDYDFNFGQVLKIDQETDILRTTDDSSHNLSVDQNGILYGGTANDANRFVLDSNGIISINTTQTRDINNLTDDMYTYINFDMVLENKNCTELTVENKTIGEKTVIKNLKKPETVTLSAKQFIQSDNEDRENFGDDFNFVWPRLQPGLNTISVFGNGSGSARFSYRYPMKVGDCAMDVISYDE